MKHLIFLIFTVYCSGFSSAQECDSIPELNRKVVRLAKGKTGKKVDRGECWDLADYVLTETNANWDGRYIFGRLVNPEKECVLPGDIIQFEKVRLKYSRDGVNFIEQMDHHTAIVASIISNNEEVMLIHQNTGEHGKKVGESPFDFTTVVKGKIFIYRPIPSAD